MPYKWIETTEQAKFTYSFLGTPLEKKTEKQIDAWKSLIVSGKTDQLKQVQRIFPQNIANDLIRNRLTEIKVVQEKISLIRIWQSVSKTFNLLEGRAGNMSEEI